MKPTKNTTESGLDSKDRYACGEEDECPEASIELPGLVVILGRLLNPDSEPTMISERSLSVSVTDRCTEHPR